MRRVVKAEMEDELENATRATRDEESSCEITAAAANGWPTEQQFDGFHNWDQAMRPQCQSKRIP